MLNSPDFLKDIWIGAAQLIQLPPTVVDPTGGTGIVVAPNAATFVFSSPQFFIALISGIVLAFGFQLLLTNLSVAAGISYLGNWSKPNQRLHNHSGSHSDSHSHSHSDDDSSSSGVNKIRLAAGLWTVISVSLALFFACFLAVKLTLIQSALLGAIIGLVIWGAYFSLLVWISSTTVGSLVGSLVNAATSGLQAIVGTATAALGAAATKNQIVSTAESAVAAVRRELTSGMDPETLRENVEEYLNKLRPPGLDVQSVRQEFEKLLDTPELKAIGNPEDLRQVDRATLVNLISSRTDLSKREVESLADQLETAWQQTVSKLHKPDPLKEVTDYLKTVKAGQFLPQELSQRLNGLLNTVGQGGQGGAAPAAGALLSGLMGIVLNRVDLSDLDVGRMVEQLKSTPLGEKTDKMLKKEAPYSVIRADVEDYLLNTYSWQLTPESIQNDFRAIIYDEFADASSVRREVELLNQQEFVTLLQSRGVFVQDQISRLAQTLEAVRLDVLREVSEIEETEKAYSLKMQLEDFLRSSPKETLLTPQMLNTSLRPILQDSDADKLRSRLVPFNRDFLIDLLNARTDLTTTEVAEVTTEIERSFELAVADAQGIQQGLQTRVSTQWQRMEDYLRNTGKSELNPEGIQRDLQKLVDDPQVGLSRLRDRASQLDRDTLVKLLSQRNDLNESEVNNVIDQYQSTLQSVIKAPRRLAIRTQSKVRDFKTGLEDYLRNTQKEELSPEGIQRDLKTLMSDPRLGIEKLSDRLSHVDRSTLIALLSQRQDLSEAEANDIVDRVLAARDQLTAQVQAVQQQIQATIEGVLNRIRNYLNSLDRPELNYDGIKQEVRTLFDDPQAGFESLRDRLSSFDKDTLIALLSSRDDISKADAERVFEQIDRARSSVLQRAERLQQQVQNRLDDIKYQAQVQVEETRKAAATAAWWLFATALTSAIVSAIAGSLAVAPRVY